MQHRDYFDSTSSPHNLLVLSATQPGCDIIVLCHAPAFYHDYGIAFVYLAVELNGRVFSRPCKNDTRLEGMNF